LFFGLVGVSEHDQTFNGPVTGRRWKIYRPSFRTIGESRKTSQLIWAWRGISLLPSPRPVGVWRTTSLPLVRARLSFSLPIRTAWLFGRVNRNWTALEPRIGAAWKVLGSEKTVLRGGYAIYHDSAWSQGAQGLWQNPPFFAEGDNLGWPKNSGITFGPQQVGCPTTTSYCASLVGGPAVTGVTTSQGFPIFNTPPDLATFTGTFFYQPGTSSSARFSNLT